MNYRLKVTVKDVAKDVEVIAKEVIAKEVIVKEIKMK